MAWQTKGKGRNFLQAALEGAVVNALGLADFGKGKDDKGKKGDGRTRNFKKVFCPWADCTAAQKQQATVGGGANCHCCRRAFSQAPPLEKLVEWAYKLKLQAPPTTSLKAGKDGRGAQQEKGKGNGKGKAGKGADKQAAPAAAQADDDLKALRAARLAELKTAKDAQAAPPTVLQEVAKVFDVEDNSAQRTLQLLEALVTDVAGASAQAKKVVDSVHAEILPSQKELPTPDITLAQLLQSVKSCASVATKEAAERALSATSQAVVALQACGTSDTDADLLMLLKRQVRQRGEVTRLTDKAPTFELRRLALAEARVAYEKQLQAEQDFTARGKQKAKARIQEREQILHDVAEVIDALKRANAAAGLQLQEEHDVRAAKKNTLGIQVLNLIDEKIDNLEDEDMNNEEAEDATKEEATVTEVERERLRSQLRTLQQATAAEKDAGTELAISGWCQQAQSDELAKALAEVEQLKATLEVYETLAAPGGAADAPAAQAASASSIAAPGREDLWLEFAADTAQVPLWQGAPTDDQKSSVLTLAALFSAMPWGSPMPATTFDLLHTPPCFVHGMVGDEIWQTCWGDRHTNITGAHSVPYKMLHILKWAVETNAPKDLVPDLDAGRARYKEILQDHIKARQTADGKNSHY